jgi:hypothetical protein
MSPDHKIRIARAGKLIGEFGIWEVKQKWIASELSMSDDYWRSGMTRWGKLQDIKEEILASAEPVQHAPRTESEFSQTTPPLPPPVTASDESPSGFKFVGVIVFIIGAFTLLCGFASDATGSAIRQGVFAQHMTNGILLMILGVLLAKR